MLKGFDAYTSEGVSGKYEVLGDDMQILAVSLKDGELLTCEPGSMSFMSNDINVSNSEAASKETARKIIEFPHSLILQKYYTFDVMSCVFSDGRELR